VQLFGLLCSLLKVASDSSRTTKAGELLLPFDNLFQKDVITKISSMLQAAQQDVPPIPHPGEVSSSGSNTAGTSTFTSTAALPWLVLLGRYCYAGAVGVQQWLGHLESDGVKLSRELSVGAPHLHLSQTEAVVRYRLQLQSHLNGVVQGLAAAGTVQQLTTLGYQPQDLQQQLAAAADALPAHGSESASAATHRAAEEGTAAVIALRAVREQLLAAARVLAVFAIPHACNNLTCSNMCGPLEAQLVGGRSCICAGCRTARYCGKPCQRAAWRQHKPVCSALAAAAAAAASGEATALLLAASDGSTATHTEVALHAEHSAAPNPRDGLN
jgi:hypothetical protein